MKKTIYYNVLLLLITFAYMKPLMAQEGVKIGFRASPLISWASVVNEVSKTKPEGLTTKAGLGFSFDFVVTYGLTESVGFKSGINIASKSVRNTVVNLVITQEVDGSGAVVSTTTTGYDTTAKIGFTSVEIPLGLKFRSPEIGTGIFIIGHFGMNAELNLKNKIRSEGTVTSLTEASGVTTEASTTFTSERVDVDGIRLFTASFVPGIGVDWEFDWGMLEMGLTYHWGLLSYTNPDKFSGLKSRLNYIALNLGYFF